MFHEIALSIFVFLVLYHNFFLHIFQNYLFICCLWLFLSITSFGLHGSDTNISFCLFDPGRHDLMPRWLQKFILLKYHPAAGLLRRTQRTYPTAGLTI